MSSPWSAERRARASEAARARWLATPPEVRRARQEQGWETYQSKYPERAAAYELAYGLIAIGELEPGPCEACGVP